MFDLINKEPLSKHGDLMTIEEFIDICISELFIDDDWYWCLSDWEYRYQIICPSDVSYENDKQSNIENYKKMWATHVQRYNR